MHLKYRKVQDSVIDKQSDKDNNIEDSFHGEMDSVVARWVHDTHDVGTLLL